MSLTLIQQLQQSLGQDLMRFMPELILCGGIVLLLLMRLFNAFNTVHLGWIALGVVLVALAVSIQQWVDDGINSRYANLFTGMLAYDGLAIFLRLFLFSVTALVIVLS